MRLIQFTASKVWRGHEQKIIYLYEAYENNKNIEDQWIVCPLVSEIYEVAVAKGMQVIPFNFKSEYSLTYAKNFKKLVLEKNADVVLIHNSKAHTIAVLSAFIFGLKSKLVLCRTLIKRVDTNFFRKWKYNYKGIVSILCVSQAVVESLKPAVKDHNKFKIIGSVTDIDKFPKQASNGFLHNELNIDKTYKLIGNIAEFTAFKDHYTWIDTVEILVKENKIKAKYILVGKGKLMEEIQNYVKSKNLSEHIFFLGFRRDIPEILPEFDLFMFTSKNEPTGGVLLESYACKVPIVAANAGGIPEVIVDQHTGLLAEAGNPRDFADKVVLLLNDKTLQNTLVENGNQHLKANFTKDVISNKFYEALNEALTN
ncbi:glycosyltransferase family 4 protein [Winogradskyella eckloniae]|uniref:glycosyltransferase family 4 protein n=1 Tax=Winogradskyella eckloniae TaxID=1089306 RepID=UPI001565C931|nr:glycosyltransferase family 4 protein [Winogradskyella eckloniae]NRD19643.1 glycosyltransferase family 4 protein [Winogradskyella eckloniae]